MTSKMDSVMSQSLLYTLTLNLGGTFTPKVKKIKIESKSQQKILDILYYIIHFIIFIITNMMWPMSKYIHTQNSTTNNKVRLSNVQKEKWHQPIILLFFFSFTQIFSITLVLIWLLLSSSWISITKICQSFRQAPCMKNLNFNLIIQI